MPRCLKLQPQLEVRDSPGFKVSVQLAVYKFTRALHGQDSAVRIRLCQSIDPKCGPCPRTRKKPKLYETEIETALYSAVRVRPVLVALSSEFQESRAYFKSLMTQTERNYYQAS